MPIYEYECEECGRRTEALQRVAEDPLTECPHCAGRLRKLISAPAFQFKGSGWYVTDYAGKGSGGEKGGEKGGEGGEKGGGKGSEKASGENTGGGSETAGEKSGGKKAGTGDKAAAD